MSYQLIETPAFRRCLDDYNGQPAVHKAWGQLQAVLRSDPHRIDTTKKLKAMRCTLYRSKVDDGRRVIWAQNGRELLLLLFGEHDEVYARAARISSVDHDEHLIRYEEEEIRVVRQSTGEKRLLLDPWTDRELLLIGVPTDQLPLARALEEAPDLEKLRRSLGEDVAAALTLLLEGWPLEDVLSAKHVDADRPANEGVSQLVAQAVDEIAINIDTTLEQKMALAGVEDRQRIDELEEKLASFAAVVERAEQQQADSEQRSREYAKALADLKASPALDVAAAEAAEAAVVDAERAAATAELRAATAQAAAQREATTSRQAAAALDHAVVTPGPAETRAASPVKKAPAKKAPPRKTPPVTAASTPPPKPPPVKKAPAQKAPAKKAPRTTAATPPVKSLIEQSADVRKRLDKMLADFAAASPSPSTSSTAAGKDPAIGSVWTGPTTGRPYSLLLKADVVDRTANRHLSQVLGTLGRATATRLLEGRPEGGRITVTRDGHVIARRTPGGPLTYVGRVTADEWFPGHVTYRPQPIAAAPRPSFGGPPPPVRRPQIPAVRTASGTVSSIMTKLWGLRLGSNPPARFKLTGWTYEGFVQIPCERCQTALAELRKPMAGANRSKRYWALVCTNCPAVYTPDQIDEDRWQHRRVRYKP